MTTDCNPPADPTATARQRARPYLIAILGLIILIFLMLLPPSSPDLRDSPFATDIPAACRQILWVRSPSITSPQARMQLMQRASATSAWQQVGPDIPVTLGHAGLGWGKGLHQSPPPAGFPEKIEGDKRSPAGLFLLPTLFGMAPATETGPLNMPYIALRPGIIGVDDPASTHYNQIVDSRLVTRDWSSNESMSRHKKLYRWGAFVAHNPEGIPGAGSCIFLHLWPGEGRSTSGCTAMSEADIERVIRWLAASQQPCLLQEVLQENGSIDSRNL